MAVRVARAARGACKMIEVVQPAAAEVLGVLVDGVPVGEVGPGWFGDRLPAAGVVGEHPQPLGVQHVGVVDRGGAGGVVGVWWSGWVVAVAMAVALVPQVLVALVLQRLRPASGAVDIRWQARDVRSTIAWRGWSPARPG